MKERRNAAQEESKGKKGNVPWFSMGFQLPNSPLKSNSTGPSMLLQMALFCSFLEIVILSEVSQTEKDKYRMISLICGI